MLASSLNKNSKNVLFAFVALGFAFTLIELVAMGHTRGPQMLSIIACALGVVFALAGMFAAGARKIIAILFVVLALTGIFGFMAHGGARGFRQSMVASAQVGDNQALQRAVRSFSNMPPTLAPLILSGLSLFGAAVTLMAVGETTQTKAARAMA